eukprot:9014862-Pyramimonas_sp.AAC.1
MNVTAREGHRPITPGGRPCTSTTPPGGERVRDSSTFDCATPRRRLRYTITTGAPVSQGNGAPNRGESLRSRSV